MAYVAPTPVSDGNALSAANLNALSDAVEYLYGVASAPQVAMNEIVAVGSETHYVAFQYLHRYLHIKFIVAGTGTGDVTVRFDNGAGSWIKVAQDSSASSSQTVVVDLEQSPFYWFDIGTDTTGNQTGGVSDISFLTVGAIQEVKIEFTMGGLDSITLVYIINADAASL